MPRDSGTASSSYSGEKSWKEGEEKMEIALKRSALEDDEIDDERMMRAALGEQERILTWS